MKPSSRRADVIDTVLVLGIPPMITFIGFLRVAIVLYDASRGPVVNGQRVKKTRDVVLLKLFRLVSQGTGMLRNGAKSQFWYSVHTHTDVLSAEIRLATQGDHYCALRNSCKSLALPLNCWRRGAKVK